MTSAVVEMNSTTKNGGIHFSAAVFMFDREGIHMKKPVLHLKK
jgi:hypothetical protein